MDFQRNWSSFRLVTFYVNDLRCVPSLHLSKKCRDILFSRTLVKSQKRCQKCHYYQRSIHIWPLQLSYDSILRSGHFPFQLSVQNTSHQSRTPVQSSVQNTSPVISPAHQSSHQSRTPDQSSVQNTSPVISPEHQSSHQSRTPVQSSVQNTSPSSVQNASPVISPEHQSSHQSSTPVQSSVQNTSPVISPEHQSSPIGLTGDYYRIGQILETCYFLNYVRINLACAKPVLLPTCIHKMKWLYHFVLVQWA